MQKRWNQFTFKRLCSGEGRWASSKSVKVSFCELQLSQFLINQFQSRVMHHVPWQREYTSNRRVTPSEEIRPDKWKALQHGLRSTDATLYSLSCWWRFKGAESVLSSTGNSVTSDTCTYASEIKKDNKELGSVIASSGTAAGPLSVTTHQHSCCLAFLKVVRVQSQNSWRFVAGSPFATSNS